MDLGKWEEVTERVMEGKVTEGEVKGGRGMEFRVEFAS